MKTSRTALAKSSPRFFGSVVADNRPHDSHNSEDDVRRRSQNVGQVQLTSHEPQADERKENERSEKPPEESVLGVERLGQIGCLLDRSVAAVENFVRSLDTLVVWIGTRRGLQRETESSRESGVEIGLVFCAETRVLGEEPPIGRETTP
jgi:hypothetical protein